MFAVWFGEHFSQLVVLSVWLIIIFFILLFYYTGTPSGKKLIMEVDESADVSVGSRVSDSLFFAVAGVMTLWVVGFIIFIVSWFVWYTFTMF